MLNKNLKLQKDICFFLPSNTLGGCEMLFIRIANYLAQNTHKKISYIDYSNGIASKLIVDDVHFIQYSNSCITFNNDVVVVAPVTLASELDLITGKNVQFLFWNLHPRNIEWLQLRSGLKRNKIHDFIRKIINANGLISMDFATNETVRVFTNKNTDIVPVVLDNVNFKIKTSLINEDEINIGWCSRLDEDKIYSLLNLMENFKNYKTLKKKVLHIIGSGNSEALIDFEYYSKFFKIIRKGTIQPSELPLYLSSNIDCLFSMGTSLLEASKIATPSVMCFLYSELTCENSFVFSYKLKDYTLGCTSDTDCIKNDMQPLENILDSLIQDINKCSISCREHFANNFLIDNQINNFIYCINNCSNKHKISKNMEAENMKKVTQKIIDFVVRKNKTVKFFKFLQKSTKRKFLIFVSSYSYFRDMVQRSNHLFELFTKDGYTILWSDEFINQPLEVMPNIWLFPIKDSKALILSNKIKDKIVMSVSTHYTFKDLESILLKASKKGIKVVYEHIDDITLIPNEKKRGELQKRFEKLCKDENIVVTASADILYNQAQKIRGSNKNIVMAKNAVNLDHYKEFNFDERFEKMVSSKFPIVGYWGCIFPEWFDFELLKYAVSKNPDINFVLIGPHNKTCILELEKYPNFLCLDRMPYDELKNYAKYFSAATIPFQINSITESTNPVKLFEYMALGLPTVVTPLKECKNYKTPLIANNKEEYSSLLKKAIELKNNEEFQKSLKEEASANTWQNTYHAITNALK